MLPIVLIDPGNAERGLSGHRGRHGRRLGRLRAGRGRRVVVLEQEAQPGFHATGRSAALFSETYGNADGAAPEPRQPAVPRRRRRTASPRRRSCAARRAVRRRRGRAARTSTRRRPRKPGAFVRLSGEEVARPRPGAAAGGVGRRALRGRRDGYRRRRPAPGLPARPAPPRRPARHRRRRRRLCGARRGAWIVETGAGDVRRAGRGQRGRRLGRPVAALAGLAALGLAAQAAHRGA